MQRMTSDFWIFPLSFLDTYLVPVFFFLLFQQLLFKVFYLCRILFPTYTWDMYIGFYTIFVLSFRLCIILALSDMHLCSIPDGLIFRKLLSAFLRWSPFGFRFS